jgi:hypothetical protein
MPYVSAEYAAAVSAKAEPAAELEPDVWRPTLQIVHRPAAAFELLRDETSEMVSALQEPLIALVWLAGIAGVLTSSVAVNPLDQSTVDGLTFAAFAFAAGGAYGLIAYFLVGGALYVGVRGQGSEASYRLARHVLAFSSAPVVLTLLLVWPIRLALYGGDLFHAGGSDGGTPNAVFGGILAVFGIWSLALLALGVRVVYEWSWSRALGAVLLSVVVLGLFSAIPAVL